MVLEMNMFSLSCVILSRHLQVIGARSFPSKLEPKNAVCLPSYGNPLLNSHRRLFTALLIPQITFFFLNLSINNACSESPLCRVCPQGVGFVKWDSPTFCRHVSPARSTLTLCRSFAFSWRTSETFSCPPISLSSNRLSAKREAPFWPSVCPGEQ